MSNQTCCSILIKIKPILDLTKLFLILNVEKFSPNEDIFVKYFFCKKEN